MHHYLIAFAFVVVEADDKRNLAEQEHRSSKRQQAPPSHLFTSRLSAFTHRRRYLRYIKPR
jgi:hypothetical protein